MFIVMCRLIIFVVTAQMNILPNPKIAKPVVDEEASNTVQSVEENSQGIYYLNISVTHTQF